MMQQYLIPTFIDQSERLLIVLQWLYENPAVAKLLENEIVYIQYRDGSVGSVKITDEKFELIINNFQYCFTEELSTIYKRACSFLANPKILYKHEKPTVNKYTQPLPTTKINKLTHGTTIKITRT